VGPRVVTAGSNDCLISRWVLDLPRKGVRMDYMYSSVWPPTIAARRDPLYLRDMRLMSRQGKASLLTTRLWEALVTPIGNAATQASAWRSAPASAAMLSYTQGEQEEQSAAIASASRRWSMWRRHHWRPDARLARPARLARSGPLVVGCDGPLRPVLLGHPATLAAELAFLPEAHR
jgi:hypothetical protein